MLAIETKPALAECENGASDESAYQIGFAAALNPDTFEKAYEDVIHELQVHYKDIYNTESFRRGYERGQDYVETLEER